MESERERLGRMYAELGDEHLRDLADAPDELTDDARLALAAELKRRGWTAEEPVVAEGGGEPVVVEEEQRQSGFGTPIPGVVPGGATAVEQALEPGGEVRQGMARLLSFFDGHELTRACEVLEEANLEFALEEVAGDGVSLLAPHFEIWVEEGQQEAARDVLRAKMGLFPRPEVDGEPEGDGVVGVFETRAEAEEVRSTLEANGFGAHVEAQEELGFAVIVPPAEQERALETVANRMGLE